MTTLMIGDSLTAWNDWQETVGQHLNHGVPGDTTGGLLTRLQRSLSADPDRVIMMIGTNDFMMHTPVDMVKANYSRLLDELAGIQHLYILSVAPVEESPYTQNINENIIALNHWLKVQSEKYSYTYVDVHRKLLGSGIGIKPEFTDDGVHLTEAAYEVWQQLLKEALA